MTRGSAEDRLQDVTGFGQSASGISSRPGWIPIATVMFAAAGGFAIAGLGWQAAVALLCVALAPVMLARPYWAFCLVVGLVGLDALSTLHSTEVYTLTLTKIAGVVLLLAIIPHVMLQQLRPRFDAATWTLVFLLIWMIPGIARAINFSSALSATLTYIQLAVFWLIARMLCRRIEQLQTLGTVMILTMGISALVGILQFSMVPESRISGTSQNAAILSSDLYVALAFCVAMFFTTSSARVRILLSGGLLILTTGLIVTLSRAAYLALVPAVIVGFIVFGRMRYWIPVIGVALVLLLASLPLVQSRLMEIDPVHDKSTRGHLYSIAAGGQLIADNPLFGVGVGNYPEYYLQYTNDPLQAPRSAHDTYLTIGAELGLPGLLAFLLLHVWALKKLWQTAHLARLEKRFEIQIWAAVLAAALIALMIIGVFHSLHISKYLWLLFALGMEFPRIARDENN